MAIKFIRCRRVDDHSKTADIAESALQHLTGWEPIPEEPDAEPTPEPAAPPRTETATEAAPAPEPDSTKGPETPRTSRKTRENKT